MPSSPTTRNRIEKQNTGENVNTWGDKLNQSGLELLDEALDGVETIDIASTAVTLTSINYASDQARNRALVLTGTLTGNTMVTVPGVEKVHLVDDQTTRAGFTLALKTSGGAGYALRPGPQWVYCDATDVRRGQPRMDQMPLPAAAVDMNGQRLIGLGAPTSPTDGATKKYVDDTAFAVNAGQLPGQSGSAGQYLTTNGTVAAWAPAPVLSFNGRTGAVTPQAGDYTPTQVGALAVAGGALTGPVQQTVTTLTASANVFTPDCSLSNEFDCGTIGANSTIANPTNVPASGKVQPLSIKWTQDGTGGRTMSFGANCINVGGPIANTAAGKTNFAVGKVYSDGKFYYSIVRGV